MKDLIAKRYVKALVESFKEDELGEVLSILKKIEAAFDVDGFEDFIASPGVSEAEKMALVLDIAGSENTRLVNFVKILGEKGRFGVVPQMCEELEKRNAASRNEYAAVVVTQDSFDEAVLKNIESTFASKLHVSLVLTQQIAPKEGVKLIVDDLGVEVSFSKEKFVNDLKSHVLKAF